MAVTRRTKVVDAAELRFILTPRDDIVGEVAVVADAHRAEFVQDEGAFRHYRRTVEVHDADSSATETTISEIIEWQLNLPIWWVPYWIPTWYALTHRSRTAGKQPWWAPPSRIDQRTANVIGLLATLAIFSGYLGSILSQTITFITEEFGNSKSDQSAALAIVRVGIPIALGLLALADRIGRRLLLLGCGVAASLVTATAVASPNLVALTASQSVARAITTALALLIGIVAAEELPAGSRAYGASVLAMAAAFGSGVTVWLLPLTDINASLWRVIYLVPLAFIPVIIWIIRQLPESKRFLQNENRPREAFSSSRGRLVLLAVSAFLFLFFAAPGSQLQNEYLRSERGFSGADITLFTIVTATPAGLGVFFGGRLADLRGRRIVGVVGILGGAVFGVIAYNTSAELLWLATSLSVIIGGLTVPALGVYLPELFSTRDRGTANGIITIFGVLGSASGLLLVGWLADDGQWGSYGPAFAAAAVAPLLYAALVWFKFPETAQRELEDINPSDAQQPTLD